MKFKPILIFLLLMLICQIKTISMVSAEREKPKGLLRQLQGVKKMFETGNPIEKAMNSFSANTKQQEIERLAQKLKISPEMVPQYQNLKNPFIPKIPAPPEPLPKKSDSKKEEVVPQIRIPDSNARSSDKKRKPARIIRPTVEEPKLPSVSKFNISGIIWDSDRPQAIINNQVVSKGDSFDGGTILDITVQGILFSYQGNTFMIER